MPPTTTDPPGPGNRFTRRAPGGPGRRHPAPTPRAGRRRLLPPPGGRCPGPDRSSRRRRRPRCSGRAGKPGPASDDRQHRAAGRPPASGVTASAVPSGVCAKTLASRASSAAARSSRRDRHRERADGSVAASPPVRCPRPATVQNATRSATTAVASQDGRPLRAAAAGLLDHRGHRSSRCRRRPPSPGPPPPGRAATPPPGAARSAGCAAGGTGRPPVPRSSRSRSWMRPARWLSAPATSRTSGGPAGHGPGGQLGAGQAVRDRGQVGDRADERAGQPVGDQQPEQHQGQAQPGQHQPGPGDAAGQVAAPGPPSGSPQVPPRADAPATTISRPVGRCRR